MAKKTLIQRDPKHPIIRTFASFVRIEAASGVLLLGFAVLALLWANSTWGDSYVALWQTVMTVGVGEFAISKPLLLWINDGLMAIFFFVVGLEIKREVLVGELASPKKAALPLAAAVGGMVVPAAAYVLFNVGTAGIDGWAIPMATDIAFALGVLALLGSRAPLSLKIFLTALAIADDLGAVLVIAFFYTAELKVGALVAAAAFLVALVVINRMNTRHPLPYVLLGIGLWVAFLKSGIHATIGGVLLALTIPARQRIPAAQFQEEGDYLMKRYREAADADEGALFSEQQAVVHTLEESCEAVQTPLERLEHSLHPWVGFFIMPVFALANAGVVLSGEMLGVAFGSTITLGIIAGLVLGKQLGVSLFAWLAVRLGWAELPENVSWRQVYGVAWLTGIGFTMSLFIANLGFEEQVALDSAKIGILVASLISGLGGWVLLGRAQPPEKTPAS
ncbi:MAG: Na+/H+ antiporter NhaA [Bacteroidetes bacterium]|jgi:NhaA family Na+:H+ antiporter|nr:Na+/H+ antiporter NhaA [Bacteroidota bacterium]